MKGVDHYTSKAGFHCVRVHYSADADRDPATERGAVWLEEESRGVPGGIASAQWRREQEIDWEAGGGELVFPDFQKYRHKIVVPPFTVPESWSLYGSFDYGHRNPSSFHIHAMDHDGDIWTVWEFYGSGYGYKEIARAIRKGEHYDKLCYPAIADPTIWAKTQQQTDSNDVKSVAQLFAELPEEIQIMFVQGKSGGDITAAEKINGELWHDLGNKAPRWRVFATCPKLIWELERLRYADWSSGMMENRNFREEIVDKNNHAWDDFKMFLMMFWTAPNRPETEKYADLKKTDPTSYEEWKSVDRMHQRMGDAGEDW